MSRYPLHLSAAAITVSVMIILVVTSSMLSGFSAKILSEGGI